MKRLALFMIPFAFLLLQPGCESVERVAGNVNTDQVAKVMITSGLRLATYMVVAKNPDLAPYLNGVSTAMGSYVGAMDPEVVRGYLGEVADQHVADPTERALVEMTIADVMEIYADAWVVYQDDPSHDPEMNRLLGALGVAINEGVRLVSAGDDASGPMDPLVLSRVIVVIN